MADDGDRFANEMRMGIRLARMTELGKYDG
jgi:hypothetical protein